MLKHLSPAYDEEISESPWIVAQPTPVFFFPVSLFNLRKEMAP